MRRTTSGVTASVKRSSMLAGGAASAAPSAGIEATSPACAAAPPAHAAANASSQRAWPIFLGYAALRHEDVVEDHGALDKAADDAVVMLRHRIRAAARGGGGRLERRADAQACVALCEAAVHEAFHVGINLFRDFHHVRALDLAIGRET